MGMPLGPAQLTWQFMQPITQLTPLYGLLIALVALHWLRRVQLEAQAARIPRLAWAAAFGVGFLLMAPTLENPLLIGIGAALLLLVDWWLPAYQRAPANWRPERWLAACALVLGLVAVAMALLQVEFVDWSPESIDIVLSCGILTALVGLANLLVAHFLPQRIPKAVMWLPQNQLSQDFAWRWRTVLPSEGNELSVSLHEQWAELRNETDYTLYLLGWSPIGLSQVAGPRLGLNVWLMPKNTQDQAVRQLVAGETLSLPIPAEARGIKLWYRHASATTLKGSKDEAKGPYMFRASWSGQQPNTVNRVLH